MGLSLYEIRIIPDLLRGVIDCVKITMDSKTGEELFKIEKNVPLDNHNGIWFTLFISKDTFYLYSYFLPDEKKMDFVQGVSNLRKKYGLLCSKRIDRRVEHVYWVAFSTRLYPVTISTPDTDSFVAICSLAYIFLFSSFLFFLRIATIMGSWIKWLELIGEKKASLSLKSDEIGVDKAYELQAFQKHLLEITDPFAHSHHSIRIDKVDIHCPIDALIRSLGILLNGLDPIIVKIPSLSSGYSWAIEIDCVYPVTTSIVRELCETNRCVSSLLGEPPSFSSFSFF